MINNELSRIENDFLSNSINLDKVGFYDDPNFIRVERTNPAYLNNYAKYVQLKRYDDEYIQNVRKKLPIITELLYKELVKDGCTKTSHDISTTLSRILEEEGIWNYVVSGSLSIDFPIESNIPRKYFWSVHNNARPAHSWVVVPPYYVVDLTIKQQEYTQSEEPYLPSMVLSESKQLYTPTYKDLFSPEAMKVVTDRGGKPEDAIESTIPQFNMFNKDFKSISTIHNDTIMHHIPVFVNVPDLAFIETRNLQLSGKYGYEIYRDIIKSALI